MAKYVCDVCGWIYDPAVGDPDSGIEPGTAFEDIPDDWVCPLCGVGKDDFSLVEELIVHLQYQSIGSALFLRVLPFSFSIAQLLRCKESAFRGQ